MIIVSDTTPLHYLILINRAELLAELFGESIDRPETLNKLALTNFRLPADEIVKEMLKRDKARKLDDNQ